LSSAYTIIEGRF